MGKLFIVLLKNNHMKFYDKKPKKAGNYLNSVRLFSVKSKTTSEDILEWYLNEFVHSNIKEITDWV